MSTVYLSAVLPAAARAAVEAQTAALLVSPNAPGTHTFAVPLVPLVGASDASPTHYGCNSAVASDGPTAAAAPGIVASVPGSAYQITPVAEWDMETRWAAWLAKLGLQAQHQKGHES